VILAVGCVAGNDVPDEAPSSGGSSAGSSSTQTGGSAQGGTGGGTAGSAGESGSGQGGTGTQGGTAGQGGAPDDGAGAGGDDGSGGVNACPTNGEDAACATCLKTDCCSAWLACQDDAACTACAECMDGEMDLAPCVSMGLCEFLAAEEPTAQMLTCGIDQCAPDCGLDG
jgi:hypothetical protein